MQWAKDLKRIFSHKMLYMLLHGISSGTPLLLIGGTLQAWMKDEGISLKTIGIFALVKLPYSLKPIWAPLIDRFQFNFLGRRKGWILIFQICLALTLMAIGQVSPSASPTILAFVALLIGFFSASQDIVIDAYRREVLDDEELGLGSTLYIFGYRVGLLFAGFMALRLSDSYSWSFVYALMGAIMAGCALTTFFAPVEMTSHLAPRSLKDAVIGPFIEYFKRDKAFQILLFILLYKVGDQMAANLTMPFYLELGFTKTTIGDIAKGFGLVATIIGGLFGGGIILRLGINKSLWVFGALQMVSTFGFALLQLAGKSKLGLIGVISFENLASGMGTAAYAAYMASITDKRFTATQYALLTAFMSVPMTILSAPTGYLAEAVGWFNFFTFCTLIALPGMVFLVRVAPWKGKVNQPRL